MKLTKQKGVEAIYLFVYGNKTKIVEIWSVFSINDYGLQMDLGYLCVQAEQGKHACINC